MSTTQNDTFQGMGAVPLERGVGFRVWAPFADSVHVVGPFNRWSKKKHALQHENNGYWSCVIDSAKAGQPYRYVLRSGDQTFDRIDPYARAVTNSSGNAIIVQDAFDWDDVTYEPPPQAEMVIYELHVGSFNALDEEAVNPLDSVIRKLDYLQSLGVTHIQLMPLQEFAGDTSWGYNPANIFAVEESYGGAEWLRTLVKSAHARNLGVILDVVYNHFGPSDLDLWRFDGWSENEGGGIYFYNDHRRNTPWGDTRPDYGRPEVRQYIYDNALYWLEQFKMDGLRWDATRYISHVEPAGDFIEAGWRLMQHINDAIHAHFPKAITIAEDMQGNPDVTWFTERGGAGFDTQWDGEFVRVVRQALLITRDEDRDVNAVAGALNMRLKDDAFNRVVFTESHDAVANGQARIPEEVSPEDKDSIYAKKRAMLGSVLVLTAPGIPMLFMGQEFLEDDWFDDKRALDWQKAERHAGLVQLHRDLIALRRNVDGKTRGLSGQHVATSHVNNADKVLAYLRWHEGGEQDATLVVVNFSNDIFPNYTVGVPSAGTWCLRFNSDSPVYDEEFLGVSAETVEAEPEPYDELPASLTVSLGAYSAIILSQ